MVWSPMVFPDKMFPARCPKQNPSRAPPDFTVSSVVVDEVIGNDDDWSDLLEDPENGSEPEGEPESEL